MKYIKTYENLVTSFGDLEIILLNKGGERVVNREEIDLVKLVRSGKFYEPKELDEYILHPLRACQCHYNACAYYDTFIKTSSNSEEEINISTGWALSDDGLWRQHSWIYFPIKNSILETTVERVMYYGILLEGQSHCDFVSCNDYW